MRLFLQASAMVGLSLVVIPAVIAVHQIQKYGMQKVTDFGGTMAGGITGIGASHVGAIEEHFAQGYTALPGPLYDDSIPEDISCRLPEENAVALTSAMERRKNFSNPMIQA